MKNVKTVIQIFFSVIMIIGFTNYQANAKEIREKIQCPISSRDELWLLDEVQDKNIINRLLFVMNQYLFNNNPLDDMEFYKGASQFKFLIDKTNRDSYIITERDISFDELTSFYWYTKSPEKVYYFSEETSTKKFTDRASYDISILEKWFTADELKLIAETYIRPMHLQSGFEGFFMIAHSFEKGRENCFYFTGIAIPYDGIELQPWDMEGAAHSSQWPRYWFNGESGEIYNRGYLDIEEEYEFVKKIDPHKTVQLQPLLTYDEIMNIVGKHINTGGLQVFLERDSLTVNSQYQHSNVYIMLAESKNSLYEVSLPENKRRIYWLDGEAMELYQSDPVTPIQKQKVRLVAKVEKP